MWQSVYCGCISCVLVGPITWYSSEPTMHQLPSLAQVLYIARVSYLTVPCGWHSETAVIVGFGAAVPDGGGVVTACAATHEAKSSAAARERGDMLATRCLEMQARCMEESTPQAREPDITSSRTLMDVLGGNRQPRKELHRDGVAHKLQLKTLLLCPPLNSRRRLVSKLTCLARAPRWTI